MVEAWPDLKHHWRKIESRKVVRIWDSPIVNENALPCETSRGTRLEQHSLKHENYNELSELKVDRHTGRSAAKTNKRLHALASGARSSRVEAPLRAPPPLTSISCPMADE